MSEHRPGGDSATFSLVLLGFRNDLARHRAQRLIDQLVPCGGQQELPRLILAGTDHAAASRLAARLDELGAVVRVDADTPLDDESNPPPQCEVSLPPEQVDNSASFAPPPFRIRARDIRLLIIMTVGAFLITRQLRFGANDDPPVERPAPAFPTVRVPGSSRVTSRTVSIPRNFSRATAGAQAHRDKQQVARIRKLIERGDLGAARDLIAEQFPDDDSAVALALRGDMRAAEGDLEAARSAYEHSVDLGGEDPEVFLALAALYRQGGRQNDAVAMLHRAEQNGARGKDFDILKKLVVAEQEAESSFGSTVSAHFTVSFDEGADVEAAQVILSHLEDAYMTVGHRLGQYPSHRTPVALYAAHDFQQITHSPEWAGALYDGRIKIPVRGLLDNSPELARTLRHEYAHSLIVTLSAGRCPVWLNEGVAMWVEDDGEGARDAWASGMIGLQPPRRLGDLEKSFMRLSPLQATAAYAQSYLAVRHLVARYGERALQNLLAAFATSTDTDEAFRDALPLGLSSFEDEFRATLGIRG